MDWPGYIIAAGGLGATLLSLRNSRKASAIEQRITETQNAASNRLAERAANREEYQAILEGLTTRIEDLEKQASEERAARKVAEDRALAAEAQAAECSARIAELEQKLKHAKQAMRDADIPVAD